MPDPMHFERNADLYDRARPPYPAALWERLRELGVLRPGLRALDLGAGSGQATETLARAGLEVTAIEPGRALAARLAGRVPGVEVLNCRVEDAVLATGAYDVATAATSIHWFDLDAVLPLLHRALAKDGRLAVWRNAFGDGTVEETPFRRGVREIVERRGAPPRPGPGEEETERWAAALETGGFFERERVETFRWTIELGAAAIRDLFTTFSDWSPSEAEEAGRIAAALGGNVLEHYTTPLIVLRRRDGLGVGPR